MSSTALHPPEEVLARYAAAVLAPGAVALGEAEAAALEDHELVCAECRHRLAELVVAGGAGRRLELGWAIVDAELAAPRPRRLERLVRALGAGSATARLLVATPALRRAWFVAIAIALLFGLAAADPGRPDPSELLFLLVAPLVPVAGVALAYGRGSDPAHDMVTATPVSGFRLVALRAVAVLATAIATTGVAALGLTDVSPRAAAWLVPALALSAACVALMSWLAPRVAGVVVTGAWLVLVSLVNGLADDRFAAFSGPAQVAWAVVAAMAAVVVVLRRRAYDAPEVRA